MTTKHFAIDNINNNNIGKMGSSSRSEDETTSVQPHGRGGGGGSKYSTTQDNNGSSLRPYSPVAETLFRKDLISAMKLPDNEPLANDDYWVVSDTWKQEWEKGVQVPVRPDLLPEARVSKISNPPHSANRFQFPRKLLCMSRSGVYTSETHQVTPMALRSEQVCSYDLDDMDTRWLAAFNGERALSGASLMSELEMEKAMEEFEMQCHEKINSTLKSNEEMDDADDGVICDVCRSPDSEDCNEMVFCEKCNICVHQACYGITSIPSGPWLCKTCDLGIKPKCELCPNRGGAMKSTKNGNKWAHVSCALWIPEVSIECVEKMEPITQISSIPPSRWNLICVLCKERIGCCIQCSVKTCKTAYHVTCAFKRGLEMRAIIEDENADDGVKLRSYCQKHSLNQKRRDSDDSDDDGKKKHMTAEERSLARRHKIAKIESEFYKHVDLNLASKKIGSLDFELIDFLFRYWILKRKANHNKPLLPPRNLEAELLSTNQDTEREKMKKFVALRQDLERVRNLCYMVSRREKLQRSFVKLREQILAKQLEILADKSSVQQMSLLELSAIMEANHGPTVYDRIFSYPDAEVHTESDFEVILSRISGEITEISAQKKENPYRKAGVASKDNSIINNQNNLSYQRIFSDTGSESDDILNVSARVSSGGSKKDASQSSKSASKKGSSLKKSSSSTSAKSKVKKPVTRSDISDDESSAAEKRKRGRSKSGSNKNHKKKVSSKSIFSDSDSDDEKEKRQKSPVFRTKAMMKDFSVDALAKSRKDKEKVSSTEKGKPGRKKSIGGLFTSSVSAAVSKASHKDSFVKKASKKTGSTSSEQSGSSSDSEVETSGKAKSNKGLEDADKDFYPMIVPERAAARKAAAKLKVSHQDRVPISEVFDFGDKFEALSSTTVGKSSVTHAKANNNSKLKKVSIFGDSDDSSSASSRSSSPSPSKTASSSSKKSKLDKTPSNFGFVPERKAAKKASAHLKEGGKSRGSSSALSVTTSSLFGNTSPKKSPGRPRKKEHLPSLSERIRLSEDSDEEPFPFKSPRSKSPRRRVPKSPRKSVSRSSHHKATSSSSKNKDKNKALSSAAEAFLSQRESQLDDIFEEFGLGSKKSKKEPDKKLKTSEGRPEEGSQSPPKTKDVSKSSSTSVHQPADSEAGPRLSQSSSGSDESSSSSSSSSEDETSPSFKAREDAKPSTVQQKPSEVSATGSKSQEKFRSPTGDNIPEARRRDLSGSETNVTASRAAETTAEQKRSEHSKASPRSEFFESRDRNRATSLFSPLRSPLREESPPSNGGGAPPTPGGFSSQEDYPSLEREPTLSSGGDGKLPSEDQTQKQKVQTTSPELNRFKSPTSERREPQPTQQHEHKVSPIHSTKPLSSDKASTKVSMPELPSQFEKQQQNLLKGRENLLLDQHEQLQASKSTSKGNDLNNRGLAKQTDDSGFDSDEKAQQQQLQQSQQQQQQVTPPVNLGGKELTKGFPDTHPKNNHVQDAHPLLHSQISQQQHIQDHQQQISQQRSDLWEQQFAQMGQQNMRHPGETGMMNPYQLDPTAYQRDQELQNEMLYSLMQLAQAQPGNPMSQQYAAMQQQMKQYELFSQYPQFFQQCMSQLYGSGGNLDQFFQGWPGASQASSWLNQGGKGVQQQPIAPQKQQQHLNAQQSRHQQQQNASAQNPYHKDYLQQQHQHHPQQFQVPSLQNDAYSSSLFPAASSSPSKVQSGANSIPPSSQDHSQLQYQHRRSSKESPKWPVQSPRGGGGVHLQKSSSRAHEQRAEVPNSSSLPSATQAEDLPGHPRSKSQTGQNESQQPADQIAISKDLLDSVAAVQEMPVWKPSSERSSKSSPQKTPGQGGATPQNAGDRTPGTGARRSSTDKSFDDLVKKVVTSTSTSQVHSGVHSAMKKLTPSAGFTPHSDTRDSQQSMSDYDDMKGGVDYDDYDFEDDDDDFRPNKSRGINSVSGKKVSRGRGRPRGSVSGSRGRPRGRAKIRPINTKALEKVHKAVAGTDYDFENEFEDDDFGEKKSDFSLQALREQSKKQNMMLDARKDSIDDVKSNSVASFEFEDETGEDSREVADTSAVISKPAPTPVVEPKRGTGRGRGRGRGRPRKAPLVNSHAALPQDETANVFASYQRTELKKAEEEPPPPRLPKLKLGALLVKKESPKGSPKISKSKEDGKSPKLHHKRSSEDSEKVKVIPKITIKLGPKPEAKTADNQSKVNNDSDEVKSTSVEQATTAPSVSSKVEENEDVKPKDDETVQAKSNLSEGNGLSKSNEIPETVVDKDKEKRVSPQSPSKKVSKIDILASKLMDAKSSMTSSGSNDVNSIFGPTGPLDMSTGQVVPSTKKVALEQDKEQGSEEKSELDLLKEEMQQLSNAKGTESASNFSNFSGSTSFDNRDSNIIKSASDLPPKKSAIASSSFDDDSATRSQHLKMKFKRHTITSSTAPSAPSDASVHQTGHSMGENVSGSAGFFPRMHKKAILTKFFGEEAYPARPSNGPSVPSSSSISSAYSMHSSDHSHHHSHHHNQQHHTTVRSFNKMPKAMDSVTSVPTRADYQPQLEALERKRKREKGIEVNDKDFDKGGRGGAGRKKKGKGSKAQAADDSEYKPSKQQNEAGDTTKKDNGRKTRGKPPKKCLAESPPPIEDSGDLKAQSMKYAEEMLASFDVDPSRGSKGSSNKNSRGSSQGGGGGSSNNRKRKKKDEDSSQPQGSSKTPRLVIKFSKDSSNTSKNTTPETGSKKEGQEKEPEQKNNGLDAYNYPDENEGDQKTSNNDGNSTDFVKKIKIKMS